MAVEAFGYSKSCSVVDPMVLMAARQRVLEIERAAVKALSKLWLVVLAAHQLSLILKAIEAVPHPS